MLGTQITNRPFREALTGLNPEQASAVSHVDGPLLILAGAGSGKTRVLVHRIAYLIEETGVPPWAIIGITFTNKAAREMKARVEALLPDQSASIWISTFHSACVRMLRRDVERLGYTRDFTILDRDDQLALVKDCIRELNLSDKQYVPKTVLEHIGRAKDETLSPEQYATLYATDFFRRKIHEIYKLYQAKLKKSNAMDFDDIILTTIRLLTECPDIRDYYQNRFRYVMVDEYQDTNTAQYELISLLCGKWRNLCVVGDDDQSIYGWRGANVGNILNFERDYRDARVIKLEQNYRSTKFILEAANKVILKNENRRDKALWTENERGSAIGCVRVENEHEEAAFIAGMLKKLRLEEGLSWNDFSILYRINAQSRAIENTLIREGIPYRIIGGFRFFDRKEIKDILAYLRLILNAADDVSFKRVINIPKRGIGAATIEKLEVIADEQDISVFEAAELVAKNPAQYPQVRPAASKLAAFAALVRSLAAVSQGADISTFFDLVVGKTGISAMYEADRSEEGRARLENILEFKSELLEFEKSFESDDIYFMYGGDAEEAEGAGAPGDDGTPAGRQAAGLSDFLSHVTLISDIDNFEEEEEKISLMTMHSAKGLEFDTVFVAGAEEGIFPGIRTMTDASQLEEERRLCYVAITRAKKRLFFSSAVSRTLFGSTTYNRVSRFVSDIPKSLLDDLTSIPARSTRGAGSPVGGFTGRRPIRPLGGGARAGIGAAAPAGAAGTGGAGAVVPTGTVGVPTGTVGTTTTGTGAGVPAAAASAGDYASGRTYRVGDAVGHKKYGRGAVTNRYYDEGDAIIEIEFAGAGMKRFIEAMVSLRPENDGN